MDPLFPSISEKLNICITLFSIPLSHPLFQVLMPWIQLFNENKEKKNITQKIDLNSFALVLGPEILGKNVN